MELHVDDYEAQIRRARQTARWVGVCAAFSWVCGLLIIVACLIAWVGFGIGILDVLDIFLAIGVGGILGGIGLYATSRSLGIAASRLEIDLVTKVQAQ